MDLSQKYFVFLGFTFVFGKKSFWVQNPNPALPECPQIQLNTLKITKSTYLLV